MQRKNVSNKGNKCVVCDDAFVLLRLPRCVAFRNGNSGRASPNSRVNTQDANFCVCINVFVLYNILGLLLHFDSKKFDRNSSSPSFEILDLSIQFSLSSLLILCNLIEFGIFGHFARFFINERYTKLLSVGRILNVPGIKIQPKSTLASVVPGECKTAIRSGNASRLGKRSERKKIEKAVSLSKSCRDGR